MVAKIIKRWAQIQKDISKIDDIDEIMDLLSAASKLGIPNGGCSARTMREARVDARIWVPVIERALRSRLLKVTSSKSNTTSTTTMYDMIMILGCVIAAHDADDRSATIKSALRTVRKSLLYVLDLSDESDDGVQTVMMGAMHILYTLKYNDYARAMLADIFVPVVYGWAMGPRTATDPFSSLDPETLAAAGLPDVYDVISMLKRGPKTAAAVSSYTEETLTRYGCMEVDIAGCSYKGCMNLAGRRDADIPLRTCSSCNMNKYCCRGCMFMDVKHSVECHRVNDYTATIPAGLCSV